MHALWLCTLTGGCSGKHTLPLCLHSVCLRPGPLIVPTVQSLVMGTHKNGPCECAGRQCQAPEPQTPWPHFHTSPAAAHCRSRSKRPAFMTLILSVHVWHTVFCLLLLIRTRAPVQHVLIPLRGRACIRLSSLFAGVPPNRCAGCLTWTCFTDFFKLQLWAPDWVRYGSANKQS